MRVSVPLPPPPSNIRAVCPLAVQAAGSKEHQVGLWLPAALNDPIFTWPAANEKRQIYSNPQRTRGTISNTEEAGAEESQGVTALPTVHNW